jgi:hypothetical protein
MEIEEIRIELDKGIFGRKSSITATTINFLLQRVEAMEKQTATMQRAMRGIIQTGHNEDCLFCGFKDRIAQKYTNIQKTK